jgi:hypothetical protein
MRPVWRGVVEICVRVVTAAQPQPWCRSRCASTVRVRANVTAYLRIASDDVGAASRRLRGVCDRAADKVDLALSSVNDRIDPADTATERRLTAV